ncbi:MAG: TetR/AcrR family transcriptional regulator [Eubacteriales bacterium]
MLNRYISRKEHIVLTAIEIIDEHGLQGFSIRELAKRENVSEASLYRHFKSKQHILLAVLDHFSYYDEMISETLNKKEISTIERLRFFFESYSEYYQSYPAITSILANFYVNCDEELDNKIKIILNKRRRTLFSIVKKGQGNGEINKEINPDVLVDIFDCVFQGLIIKWRMSDFEFSLKDRMLLTLSTLIDNNMIKL